MSFIRDAGRKLELPVLAAVFLLSAVGLAAVYSATEGGPAFFRQLLWVGLGWGALVVTAAVPYRWTVRYGWAFHLIAVVFLIVLAAKALTRGGAAYRWLTLGPLTFQPSELAKVTTALVLAGILDVFGRVGGVPRFILPALAAGIPAALVVVEPDLATAALFLPLFYAALYAAGAPLPQLALLFTPLAVMALSFRLVPFLACLGVVAVLVLIARASWWERLVLFALNLGAGVATPLFWRLLKGYQRQRILSFLSPGADPRGAGYNTIQAKIALGSGRLFGKGFLSGSQVHLKFLPAGHTDFVLPSWGEEFGFIGCAVVIILFALFIYRTWAIAYRAADRRGAILAFGLGALFLVQFAVNVAMAVGLMPVAGVPLPFVSYGGTATVVSFAAVGLILNVKLRREKVAHDLKLKGYY